MTEFFEIVRYDTVPSMYNVNDLIFFKREWLEMSLYKFHNFATFERSNLKIFSIWTRSYEQYSLPIFKYSMYTVYAEVDIW